MPFAAAWMDLEINFSSVQLLSHGQLCDPMDCSTSGFPIPSLPPEVCLIHGY